MYNLITLNDLIEIIASFITIIGTYFITKYQIINPNKTLIKQQQLENLYLPLYKLITTTKLEIVNQDIINQINLVVDENLLLICPDLFQTFLDLKTSFESNQATSHLYKRFCNIVFYDYERLKRQLGYPSTSYKDFFIRLDIPAKLQEILGYLTISILLATPVLANIFIKTFYQFSFLQFIAFYIFLFTLIIKFNDSLSSIRRRK